MNRCLHPRNRKRTVSRRLVGGCALILPVLAISACSGGGSAGSADGLQAFVGATIVDGTGAGAIDDGVLLVRDGIIERAGSGSDVEVPGGAEVIDLGGLWLVPGFINSHGHVTGDRAAALAQLQQYAHYGITTIVSLGGEEPDAFQLRDEQEAPDLDRARIYVSGPVIAPNTTEEARADVGRLAEMNVDWVKTRIDDGLDTRPKTSPEIYGEIISAAKDHGLRVAIHIVDLEDAIGIVQAGVDLVAHSVRDQPVDQTLIEAMLDADVCLVPTLTREVSTFTYAERPDFFDDPFFLDRAAPGNLDAFLSPQLQASSRTEAAEFWRNALPLALENMDRMHDAGVGVAMGTDTGPVGRFQGYFEHIEMEMMVDAGMTPAEAIYASTGGAAECMDLDGTVGTLEAGAMADLVVLEANPLADIMNTREIHSVWMAGSQIR